MGVIDALPTCDNCRTAAARYDTTLRSEPHGWATLCPDCYSERGAGRLGMGIGQYLGAWSEVGPDVRDAFSRAKVYWAGRGVQVPPPRTLAGGNLDHSSQDRGRSVLEG